MHVMRQLLKETPQMDSVLDRFFAWFRGPEKKEESSVSHEEHAPHEASEEHEARGEEPFNAFRHEEYAPHKAAEEHEAEEEEPDALSFARAAGLHVKKEHEA
jgi:hypothetical protein